MKKKSGKSIGFEMDFKGKTEAQLKREVDKRLDLHFKNEIKEVERIFGRIALPLGFYRDIEDEKQRLKKILYEKIELELYMDRISNAFDYRGGGSGK